MRYNKQNVFLNEEGPYKRYLKGRGKDSIYQYNTPKFNLPDSVDMKNFSTIKHTWKTGDRYFKLASEYYGDPKLWWVVALFNKKPTEFHINNGDTIYVPVPLETVLFYMEY